MAGTIPGQGTPLALPWEGRAVPSSPTRTRDGSSIHSHPQQPPWVWPPSFKRWKPNRVAQLLHASRQQHFTLPARSACWLYRRQSTSSQPGVAAWRQLQPWSSAPVSAHESRSVAAARSPTPGWGTGRPSLPPIPRPACTHRTKTSGRERVILKMTFHWQHCSEKKSLLLLQLHVPFATSSAEGCCRPSQRKATKCCTQVL